MAQSRADIEQLLEKYDFMEGVLLDARWSRLFRDLELTINYFWDPDWPGRVADQPEPFLLQLIGCVWAAFNPGTEFCESDLQYAGEIMTITWWSIDADVEEDLAALPHLMQAVADGCHYVYLACTNNTQARYLHAVCQEVRVTPQ